MRALILVIVSILLLVVSCFIVLVLQHFGVDPVPRAIKKDAPVMVREIENGSEAYADTTAATFAKDGALYLNLTSKIELDVPTNYYDMPWPDYLHIRRDAAGNWQVLVHGKDPWRCDFEIRSGKRWARVESWQRSDDAGGKK